MLNDRLVFKDEHEDKAKKVLENIVLATEQPSVVCIFGVPGTGKSEIAHLLHPMLCDHGICSRIWSLDSYYKIQPDERNAHREKTDIIGVEEIDWARLKADRHNRRLGVWRGVDIIEGLYSPVIGCSDMNFFVQGTLNDTYEFRKDRAKENPDNNFREYVLAIEELEVMHLGRNNKHVKV